MMDADKANAPPDPLKPLALQHAQLLRTVPAGLMFSECSVKSCRRVYDIQPVPLDSKESGTRSHGLCPACAVEAQKRVDEWARQMTAEMLLLVPWAILALGVGR